MKSKVNQENKLKQVLEKAEKLRAVLHGQYRQNQENFKHIKQVITEKSKK